MTETSIQGLTDDQTLLTSAHQGSEEAWRILVSRYAPMVQERCQRKLGDADADDATQAVFIILARRAKDLVKHPMLADWLCATAANVVRNALRDTARRRQHEVRAPEEFDMPCPPPQEDRELLVQVEEELEALAVHERQTLRLFYHQQKSHREISEILGIPIGTVGARIHRGLERLRQRMGRRGRQLTPLILGMLLGQLAAQEGASQAISEALVERLCQTSPRALAVDSTGTSLTAQALRWSKTGPSIMAIAIVSSLTLGAGALVGTLCYHWGSTTDTTQKPQKTQVVHQVASEKTLSATSPNVVSDDTSHSHSATMVGNLTLRLNDPSRSFDRLMAGPAGALLKPAAGQIEPWCRGLKWVGFGGIMEGEKLELFNGGMGAIKEGTPAAGLIQAERGPGFDQLGEKITALTKSFGIEGFTPKNAVGTVFWRGNTNGGENLEPTLEGQDPTSDVEFLVSFGPKGTIFKEPQIHFTMHFNAQEITTKGRFLESLPEWVRDPVDPRVFDQVPSSAIAAMAVRLKPRENKTNEGFKATLKAEVTNESKVENGQAKVLVKIETQKEQQNTPPIAGNLGRDCPPTTPTAAEAEKFRQKKHAELKALSKAQFQANREALVKKIKEGASAEEIRQLTEINVELEKKIEDGVFETDEATESDFLPANLTKPFETLAYSIDGHGVIWIDQQMVIPSVSMILDVSPKAFQAFIDTLPKDSQASFRTNGMTVPLSNNMITMRLVYQNGQILATTNPLGIDSILKSDHGFTKHPIVARSLAVASKKHGSVIALFRPTAILDQLAIPLALAGNEDLTKAVTGYRTSLDNTPDSRAWFSVAADGEKHTAVDAEGLIGAIGPLTLPTFLMGSGEILKLVNIN